ncbi:hypothetical protein HYQ46_006777 [Verticillium longisporum]|nr:hypothetical protein HYQ46_006777 [Verticillium longisporum]
MGALLPHLGLEHAVDARLGPLGQLAVGDELEGLVEAAEGIHETGLEGGRAREALGLENNLLSWCMAVMKPPAKAWPGMRDTVGMGGRDEDTDRVTKLDDVEGREEGAAEGRRQAVVRRRGPGEEIYEGCRRRADDGAADVVTEGGDGHREEGVGHVTIGVEQMNSSKARVEEDRRREALVAWFRPRFGSGGEAP